MPNRIVRDGMLESEAVLSLPPEGRWLYVSILLSADDYGLFEATAFKLAKKADIKREHVSALLQAMVDADLVRLYKPDLAGMRVFGFLTKFGQRLRISRAKFPLPPLSLLEGEDETLINRFKDLASGMSDACLTRDRQWRPEAEAEAEAEAEKSNTPAPSDEGAESATVVADAAAVVEKARKAGKTRKPAAAPEPPACPHQAVLALWQEVLPELPQHDPEQWRGAREEHLRARWREVAVRDAWQQQTDGLRYFGRLFRWVRRSPFLMGQRKESRQSGRVFQVTLEWLIKPANYAKVLEGHYHDEGDR